MLSYTNFNTLIEVKIKQEKTKKLVDKFAKEIKIFLNQSFDMFHKHQHTDCSW